MSAEKEHNAEAEQLRANVRKMFQMMGLGESKCSCGRSQWFVTMRSGSVNPFTDEAVSHFSDCPDAGKYRNKK